MASQDHSKNKRQGEGGAASRKANAQPDWAGGLKQLYDSVVDEPLPDAFQDLLNQLDDETMPPPADDNTSGGASGNA